jgi:uncharacterized protein (DUF4415 family)
MRRKSTGLVTYRLDPDHPPTLTPREAKAWRELGELRNEDIDLSDIPEVTGAGWRRVSELIPEGNKQQVTLRLDADVLRFFKATGRRYQSRINAALREYMNAHRKIA